MEDSLYTLLAQAGWAMVPLYACSVLAVGITLHKGFEFWRHRLGDTSLLASAEPFLSAGTEHELVAHCAGRASPVGRVMATSVHAALANPWRAQQAADRACDAEIARYRSWVATLGWIGQIAPLFGLLGTVLGMVELFSTMESTGAVVDASLLSGGIWKALLTTAAGLIVAIPTLGAHLWLTRRLQALERALEEGAGMVLDQLLGGRT